MVIGRGGGFGRWEIESLLATERHVCVRAFNGHRPPPASRKDGETQIAHGAYSRLASLMGFLLLHMGRRPTHFARCCQDCMSGTNLRLACALRIAGFNVGWALQECTPACCFARLCTSALSNTHFCRVPDSCPTPQARLPRLTGPCEPLFAKCSFIYGKVAGLPDCQP